MIKYPEDLVWLSSKGMDLQNFKNKSFEFQHEVLRNTKVLEVLMNKGYTLEQLFNMDSLISVLKAYKIVLVLLHFNESLEDIIPALEFCKRHAVAIACLKQTGLKLKTLQSLSQKKQELLMKHYLSYVYLVKYISPDELLALSTDTLEVIFELDEQVCIAIQKKGIVFKDMLAFSNEELKFYLKNIYKIDALKEVEILKTVFILQPDVRALLLLHFHTVVNAIKEGKVLRGELLTYSAAELKFYIMNNLQIDALKKVGITLKKVLQLPTEKRRVLLTSYYQITYASKTAGVSVDHLLDYPVEILEMFLVHSYAIEVLGIYQLKLEQLMKLDDAYRKVILNAYSNFIKLIQKHTLNKVLQYSLSELKAQLKSVEG